MNNRQLAFECPNLQADVRISCKDLNDMRFYHHDGAVGESLGSKESTAVRVCLDIAVDCRLNTMLSLQKPLQYSGILVTPAAMFLDVSAALL